MHEILFIFQSAWFFSDADMKESGLQLQPPPSEDPHEPVPNIDHLLANVGRTPGDASGKQLPHRLTTAIAV